jgi:hypothetical protein
MSSEKEKQLMAQVIMLSEENESLKEEKEKLTEIILVLKPRFEAIKKLSPFMRFWRIGSLAWQVTEMFFQALKDADVKV